MPRKNFRIRPEKRRRSGHLFPDAAEDLQRARSSQAPGSELQVNSPAYRLAYDDEDFLLEAEQRPVRLLLELSKPESRLKQHGIEETIVFFGSARKQEDYPYYESARRLAGLVSRRSGCDGCPQLYVVTGGGPGLMEAANRGAHDAGRESIGLNIVLPHEQYPNPYITPELCFRFHYFGMRKMHFLLRARALVVFPGGYGTLDELFETLTLVQTGKIEPLPILLFGREYWERLINFRMLVDEGMIDEADLDRFAFVDDVDTAWEIIRSVLAEEDAE